MKVAYFFICFLFLAGASATQAQVKIGQKAPDFSLKGDDGKDHRLSESRGKYVVLEWFNDGCPYVNKYYSSHRMQELQQKHVKKGVVWYSVISSKKGKQGYVDANGAKKLREKRKFFSSAILLDPDGKAGRAYGAKTTPHLFIINPEGNVVYQGAIDDQPSADPATLKPAKNYVEAAFTNLNQNKAVAISETKPYGCAVKY